MDFLENIRYKQKYTTLIKESKYTQSISNVINNIHDTSNSYKTLEELIIYTYDHNSLLNDNTKLYIDQFKLKLATDIDEKSSDKYDNYKYSKKMKKNLIQNGLQKNDTISTIIYLGDIFSIDIIIKSDDNYYQLVDRKRDIFFVEYKDGLWRSIEKCEYTLNTSDNLQNILDYNIKIDEIFDYANNNNDDYSLTQSMSLEVKKISNIVFKAPILPPILIIKKTSIAGIPIIANKSGFICL